MFVRTQVVRELDVTEGINGHALVDCVSRLYGVRFLNIILPLLNLAHERMQPSLLKLRCKNLDVDMRGRSPKPRIVLACHTGIDIDYRTSAILFPSDDDLRNLSYDSFKNLSLDFSTIQDIVELVNACDDTKLHHREAFIFRDIVKETNFSVVGNQNDVYTIKPKAGNLIPFAADQSLPVNLYTVFASCAKLGIDTVYSELGSKGQDTTYFLEIFTAWAAGLRTIVVPIVARSIQEAYDKSSSPAEFLMLSAYDDRLNIFDLFEPVRAVGGMLGVSLDKMQIPDHIDKLELSQDVKHFETDRATLDIIYRLITGQIVAKTEARELYDYATKNKLIALSQLITSR